MTNPGDPQRPHRLLVTPAGAERIARWLERREFELGMAGISASSLLLRVSATVRSLIPLRTLRAVDGAGSPW